MFKYIANWFLAYSDRYLLDDDVFHYDDIKDDATLLRLLNKFELEGVVVQEYLFNTPLKELKEKGHKYLIISERYYEKYVVYSYSYLDNVNSLPRINVDRYLG